MEGGQARLEVDGKSLQVSYQACIPERAHKEAQAARARPVKADVSVANASNDAVVSPIPGVVLELMVSKGSEVTAGQAVIRLEAMKMENTLTAHKSGVVFAVMVKVGDSVGHGQALINIK